MSIPAGELIRLFRQALDEGWGYIWGTRGQVWTSEKQAAATREMTRRYGKQWIGKPTADCSGLFVWAFRALGGDIYHGSNTIFDRHTSGTGPLHGTVALRPGTAVFQVKAGRRTHIGLYVGGGEVIEAHGTRRGVIVSSLSSWNEWGELSAVDYADSPAEAIALPPRTLRPGDAGDDVARLQSTLITLGYDLGSAGADGRYGSKTTAAVRAFQQAKGLAADGIAGAKTLAALSGAAPPEDDRLARLETRVTELERLILGETQ